LAGELDPLFQRLGERLREDFRDLRRIRWRRRFIDVSFERIERHERSGGGHRGGGFRQAALGGGSGSYGFLRIRTSDSRLGENQGSSTDCLGVQSAHHPTRLVFGFAGGGRGPSCGPVKAKELGSDGPKMWRRGVI